MIYVLIAVIFILVVWLIKKYKNIEELRKENEETVKKLKQKIEKLENELNNFIQIQNDSLNLNVLDEEPEFRNEHEEERILKEKQHEIEKESQKIIGEKSSVLNKEKLDIFNKMENTDTNMFITGKAGTGKSYLLKYFRSKTKKKVLYCAPTGIAALNIDGVTLHSAFGWNNLMEDNEIKLSSNNIEMFKRIDVLIIDEISMVRVDVFNQVDKILKYANKSDLPFGGKQVILFGDLFQLPPVAKKEEAEYFTDKYGGVFFFNSPAYKKGNFVFEEIEEIFRQTDKEFIDILNDIRVGIIKEEHIKSLNEHYVKDVPRRVVQIVPMKNEANTININNIEKLGGKMFEYKAEVLVGENIIKETDYPCDFDLKLKVGALVMMIINDPEHKRWVNGTLGIVSGLTDTMVKVTINGTVYEISPYTFSKKKCIYDRDEGTLKYVTESSVKQYPLILAYAITIHKSQGMTYQQIACNLDSCFAPGQAYVALSRCANYNKLYLTSKINVHSIITDNVVTNFYRKVKDNKDN